MLIALASIAFAGERNFAWTYGYGNVPKGGVEVEHYYTGQPAVDAFPGATQHQFEVEYGITDHLEAGGYAVFGQAGGGPLNFAKGKGRLKYRLGSQGVAPIDVALYLEYSGNATFDEHAIEGKIIVAKDVGKFVSALNLTEETVFGGDVVEIELAPTLGLGFRIAPWFTLGAESKFEMKFAGGVAEGPFVWAGPSTHLAGEGGRLWWTLGALIPATADTAADEGPVIIRSLLGINI